MTFEDIIEEFDALDAWEDKYRFVLELGRTLAPLEPEYHDQAHKVRGCASQVWLHSSAEDAAGGAGERDPVLTFRGDSDAHLVRGLIAILIALYSGQRASEILAMDARAQLARLGLEGQLTPQRSNGLFSMVERIRADAARALAHA